MHETEDVRTAVMRVPMLGDELHLLEKRVRTALRKRRTKKLGGVPGPVVTTYRHEGFTCRRLPPLPPGRSHAYETLFEEHLIRLSKAGVVAVVAEPRVIPRKDGSVVVYVVQKAVPEEMQGAVWLAARAPGDAAVTHVWDRILTLVFAAVRDGLGLDPRIHNWVVPRRDPQYLGAAVPLLRSSAGREELDLDIAFGRAPTWLRGLLGRFVLERLRAPYYTPRTAILDLLADLQRRDLSPFVEPLLLMTNGRLGRQGLPAIKEKEIAARRRNAEAADMLMNGVASLDVALRRFRRRPPRFLPPS